MEKAENACNIYSDLKGKDHLGNQGIAGRIKQIIK
jgi:hypothetical protein